MIATEHFVYIHLHKTGGTFVQECLLKAIPGARYIGYHLPARRVPLAHKGKPIVGLVRNPWSYYVSWYTFQAAKRNSNFLFHILSDGGSNGFEKTIERLLRLGDGGHDFSLVRQKLPTDYGSRGLNLPASAFDAILRRKSGFYSFLYDHMYTGAEALHVGKLEEIKTALPRVIEDAGNPPSPILAQLIASGQPRNTSDHAPYQSYYGEYLRDLIGELDGDLIKQHGYGFSP